MITTLLKNLLFMTYTCILLSDWLKAARMSVCCEIYNYILWGIHKNNLGFGSPDASAWPPLITPGLAYLPHAHIISLILTLTQEIMKSSCWWNWPGWCGLPHTLTLDWVQWVEAQSGPLPLASLLRLKLTEGFTFAWGGRQSELWFHFTV